jgi:hypothetical protein
MDRSDSRLFGRSGELSFEDPVRDGQTHKNGRRVLTQLMHPDGRLLGGRTEGFVVNCPEGIALKGRTFAATLFAAMLLVGVMSRG